jgi:hypothetical protein
VRQHNNSKQRGTQPQRRQRFAAVTVANAAKLHQQQQQRQQQQQGASGGGSDGPGSVSPVLSASTIARKANLMLAVGFRCWVPECWFRFKCAALLV